MKNFFLFTVFLLLITNTTWSQEKTSNPPAPPPPCAKTLEEMAVSYRGTTPSQVAFKLFAIKYKKDWILVALDANQNFYTYKKKPDSDDFIRNPKLFDDNICKLITANTLDIKIKPQTVGSYDLVCYYKFNKYGRRFYNALIALDDPSAAKGFWDKFFEIIALPVKGLAAITVKPISKLFTPKKDIALKKVDAIKKQKESIDKKMKALEDKKKKLEDLQKKLKKLEEEQAKKLGQKQ